MNTKLLCGPVLFTSILLLFFISAQAQVGINTIAPSDGAMLDITSGTKGVLIPRVDITDLTTIAPITGGSTESLLVYNTNTTTGKGFYFWDGTEWTSLIGNDWKQEGNAGTTPGTGAGQNFVGTSDNQDVIIASNGNAVATMTTAGQIQAANNGSASTPSYTFGSDTNTGIWHSGDDRLNISAGGREMIEFLENGSNSEIVFNDNGDDTNFRIESASVDDIVFVDANNDRFALFTDSPLNDVHISGNGTGIRVDALNSTNDLNNNGVDVTPIYVDSNGDLTLEGPLILNNMPEDNFSTFVPVSVFIGSPLGSWSQAAIYTTTITLTQDALVEVVYQIGVNITDFAGAPITDGDPRQYGTALFIDTQLVGYTSEAYTSSGTGQITSGTFYLNGTGYAQLTGVPAGTTYTVTAYGFTFGGDNGTGNGDSTSGEFGGNVGTDRFQIILHH